jgi:hypothetical protein
MAVAHPTTHHSDAFTHTTERVLDLVEQSGVVYLVHEAQLQETHVHVEATVRGPRYEISTQTRVVRLAVATDDDHIKDHARKLRL